MRLAFLVILCACSRPPAATSLANRQAIEPCDEASWRTEAASSLRERLGDRDLIVLDACYGVSRVLAKVRGAVVAATVNDRKLTRVVNRETPLWSGPGGAPLPGIVIEPGVVVHGTGAWRRVAPSVAIQAEGYVPEAATGLLWSAQPPPGTDGKKLGRYVEIVSEPRAGAEHLATISGNEPAFDRIDDGPNGWLHVTASDGAVRVTGWVEPPPPPRPPSALSHVYDFSDDVIEGDLVKPDAPAARGPTAIGCIRTRPDDSAHVIGVVTGELTGTSEDDGWVRVELPTPWGPITGHAHQGPLEDPMPAK